MDKEDIVKHVWTRDGKERSLKEALAETVLELMAARDGDNLAFHEITTIVRRAGWNLTSSGT